MTERSTETIQVADRYQAAALGMVVTERLRQWREHGYTDAKDAVWGESVWTLFMARYVGRLADVADVLGAEETEWRGRLVKLAALAVAALEADLRRTNR